MLNDASVQGLGVIAGRGLEPDGSEDLRTARLPPWAWDVVNDLLRLSGRA